VRCRSFSVSKQEENPQPVGDIHHCALCGDRLAWPRFPRILRADIEFQVTAMSGSRGRLLAVLSLIFIASVSLRGQDMGDRFVDGIPLLPPNLSMLRYGPGIEPVRPPLFPTLPRRVPVPPGTMAFQKMVSAAGIIFSGHVTAVGHDPIPLGPTPASTSVSFQVEQAIRGIEPGQILTIHEWAGLWASGEHYRVGEYVLLFLYPPSRLGLTSPVAGALGRFSMDSQGRIVMDGRHVAILGADPVLGGRAVIPYLDFARLVRRFSRQD